MPDTAPSLQPSAPPSPAPTSPVHRADRVTVASRAVAVASALGLIVLCAGWELHWARIGHGTLVLKALPLAFALPGLVRNRLYTYRWLSLAVWLYAAEGSVRIVDRAPVGALAALELVLAIVLFAACATHVRWRLAAARRAAA